MAVVPPWLVTRDASLLNRERRLLALAGLTLPTSEDVRSRT